MKFLLITSLLTVLFSVVVLSAPEAVPNKKHDDDDGRDGRRHRSGCLDDRAARSIVDRWTSLFEGDLDLLDRTVTDDVTLEDETVNFLFPPPALPPSPFVRDKAGLRRTLEFVAADVTIRNRKFEPYIIVHDCDTISFRFQASAESTGLDPNS